MSFGTAWGPAFPRKFDENRSPVARIEGAGGEGSIFVGFGLGAGPKGVSEPQKYRTVRSNLGSHDSSTDCAKSIRNRENLRSALAPPQGSKGKAGGWGERGRVFFFVGVASESGGPGPSGSVSVTI